MALNKQTDIVEAVISIALLIWWLAGFVVAKGFWSTLACLFPFYAWYLVIQKVMIVNGWV